MSDLFGWGFAAGLLLAIPVGPMAIMLINTTISRGWRHGVVGALGMAAVDFSYALLVVSVSGLVASLLSNWGRMMGLAGAAILLALGAQTAIRNLMLLRKASAPNESSVNSGTPFRTFVTFVGATILNPPTALYFLAISATLVADPRFAHTGNGIWFAVGVFVGSIIWQEGLMLAGLALRRITTNRIRAWIGALGGLAIIILAVSLAVKALS